MTPLFLPLRHAWPAWLLACAFAMPAQAERADRAQPLNVAADRQGIFDLANQVVVFSGDVIITKGTIVIKAERVEVRESSDGYRTAVAIGSENRPATFRQKRDNVEEYIEGQSNRLEYNEKTDTVRFVGDAKVYRLRGATIGDEITGNLITYDNTSEVFSVTGKPPAAAGAPGGRVRAVLTPRAGTPAAAEAASQAAPSLRSSPSLGDKQ
ncbi:lipopolysaccharide transport periplasmic protein LptA [Piscinibacter sp.]|uniref:lipopolysaccharide transport periplasmic protein LptA n=1 Tax=Piscinibacter sp. TaxID=1903157 RepID=UPI002D7F92D7|nr:lipopolysaccharide transport periplasmic protein LptA [Albitalea sp.]